MRASGDGGGFVVMKTPFLLASLSSIRLYQDVVGCCGHSGMQRLVLLQNTRPSS